MKKNNGLIEYNIMLSGDEKIFDGKKSVNGVILSLNRSGKICISYKFKRKEREVLVENCIFSFNPCNIFIHGFVREKGESKFTSVSLFCKPIKNER